jgi:hypothetical protein
MAREANRLAGGSSASAKAAQSLPADLLVIRISQRFLSEHADRIIERDQAVADHILGAEIRGRAHISGVTRFLLEQDAERAVIRAEFKGTIVSQTTGHSGKVSIDRQSRTPVGASKHIVLDSEGVWLSEASSTARTKSNTTAIRTQSKGVRGRITQRIAQKRNAESQGQIDSIASQRAAERTRSTFDREVLQFVTVMDKMLQTLPKLSIPGEGAPAMHFRSTGDHMEIVLRRRQAGPGAHAVQPPPVEGDPPIAVRVHRSLALQIAGGGKLEQMLPGLLDGKGNHGAAQKSSYKLAWSPDGNWVTLIAGPKSSAVSARSGATGDSR